MLIYFVDCKCHQSPIITHISRRVIILLNRMLNNMLGRTMENKPFRDTLIERRDISVAGDVSANSDWQKLTLAQRFSATSLTKYGYDLLFIRNSCSGSTAVMVLQNGTPATISEDGDINTTPDIYIRQ